MNSNDTSTLTKPEAPAEAKFTETRPVYTTHDEETGTRLQVALPGVAKDDLKLTVQEGLLNLEAVRRDGPNPLRYRLSARLAHRLDGDAVTANLEHGVLEVRVPLKAEAQPRSIAIQ
ncbi:MAG TPA: Hsp20/alpha crystallin family protein [Luteolibacter sp.]